MINLKRAYSILMEAELQPLVFKPVKTLRQIAEERELAIVPINVERGAYFGHVAAADETQCLVVHKAKGAILLDIAQIPQGETLPQPGDQVHIQAKNGVLKVAVQISAKRQRQEQ